MAHSFRIDISTMDGWSNKTTTPTPPSPSVSCVCRSHITGQYEGFWGIKEQCLTLKHHVWSWPVSLFICSVSLFQYNRKQLPETGYSLQLQYTTPTSTVSCWVHDRLASPTFSITVRSSQWAGYNNKTCHQWEGLCWQAEAERETGYQKATPRILVAARADADDVALELWHLID